MVAVLHAAPEASAPQAVAAWLGTLRGVYPDDDLDAFAAALDYARTRCGSARGPDGELLIDRAIDAATILASLKLDAGTVRAALLTGLSGARAFSAEEIVSRFGADVATLVAGAARMDEIRALPLAGDADERAGQAERLRKMLLAMVEDIRVVLIKLAERTAALRYLMTGDVDLRRQAAREVLDLFAPLANRLGV
jgi:GTP pyrophosphokinase